jgi:hypothetical protein
VALTVSSVEATTSVVGSLTYGDHHLSTDDSGHLRADAAPVNGGRPFEHKEVLTPVLATGVRTRPSGDADTALRRTTCCATPRCGQRRGKGRCVADLCMTRPSPARWTDSHPPTRQQVAVRLLRKAGERLSTPNAGGRSGSPAHAEDPTATQLALPPARMMNILEAKGKGEATARLALLHHKADGHHPG